MSEPLQGKSYEPISQKLLDTTLKKIQRAVKGNGAETDAIKIKSYDGIVHIFQTKTILQLKPVLAKRTEPGRNTTAILLANEGEINLKAASRIHNAVTSAGKRDVIIKSYIKKDPSKGFIARSMRIPLETLKQDYVLHKDCPTCQKQGKTPCPQCGATGKKTCDLCHGSKRSQCHQCHGQRFIMGANNSKQNCPHCNAMGTVICTKCHGQGTVSCHNCKAQGCMPCAKCAGSGVFSIINHFEAEAISMFKCDKLPKLPKDIADYLKNERTRKNFTIHAKITPMNIKDDDLSNQGTTQAHSSEHDHTKQSKQQDLIAMPFEIRCPYANITIDINGEEYTGKILGFKPKFIEFDPFIEILTKKGIENLAKSAKDKKNSRENLKKATKFSLIKEVLSLTIRNTNPHALRQLKQLYPLGVRDNQFKMMIQHTRRAIKNITLIPRVTSAALGLALSLSLYFIYQQLNGDSIIPQSITRQNNPLLSHAIQTALQASPLLITYILTIFFSKIKTRMSLRDMLNEADLKIIKTNLGIIGLLIPIIYISGAALICEYATEPENLPLWFTMLRQTLLP